MQIPQLNSLFIKMTQKQMAKKTHYKLYNLFYSSITNKEKKNPCETEKLKKLVKILRLENVTTCLTRQSVHFSFEIINIRPWHGILLNWVTWTKKKKTRQNTFYLNILYYALSFYHIIILNGFFLTFCRNVLYFQPLLCFVCAAMFTCRETYYIVIRRIWSKKNPYKCLCVC